jgi:hypothetical protein
MVLRIHTSLILGYWVGFITFLAPILGFIAPKGLAPLVIIGGLAGLVFLQRQNRILKRPNKTVVIILIGLCGWAGLSSLWAIDGQSALVGAVKLIGILLAGGLFFSVFQSLNTAERQVSI